LFAVCTAKMKAHRAGSDIVGSNNGEDGCSCNHHLVCSDFVNATDNCTVLGQSRTMEGTQKLCQGPQSWCISLQDLSCRIPATSSVNEEKK